MSSSQDQNERENTAQKKKRKKLSETKDKKQMQKLQPDFVVVSDFGCVISLNSFTARVLSNR